MTGENAAAKKPRPRNAELTRERILKMATKEFAANGFDGARIDAICKRCKISKNLVYHYFDSKEDLFVEVMERAYGDMRTQQGELREPGDDPLADMRELVLRTTQHLMNNPDFLQLLATENMHKAVHVRKSKVLPSMFNPLRKVLADTLQKGKDKGVFRQDADWVDLYVSISGLASYFVTNRYTLSYVLGVDLTDKQRFARRADHVADMVMSYLCNVASATSHRDVPAVRVVAGR